MAKIRVNIIEKRFDTTGFKKYFINMKFLNHSKWNQNNFSNFLVEYYVNPYSELYQKVKDYKKMPESEISWPAEINSKVFLKFFYVVSDLDKKQPIKYT